MGKKGLKFISLVSASLIATSCSLFATKHYDWLIATDNNTVINYALLIGQNEHSDSIERTRYTRQALGTRDEKTEVNGNANLGIPRQGHLVLADNTEYRKEFTVNEVEHMEQKSLAGVTWDAITANGTTATWLCKHGKKLTMLISNNDGMAEGALAASNWITDLPLFGYDANESALKKIKAGKIMGTVDQNAAVQTAAAYLLIRNILEDQKKGAHGIGTLDYDPLNRGFNGPLDSSDERYSPLYINGRKEAGSTKWWLNAEYEEHFNLRKKLDHAILARNSQYTIENINEVLNEKGEVKSPSELAWDDNKVQKIKDYTPPEGSFRICHVYNNAAEIYLQSTMRPYYEIYAPLLNLNIGDPIEGDGIDEGVIFNKIASAAQNEKFDAYLINMVTTTDGGVFVKKLAEHAYKKEGGTGAIPDSGWENWEERLDTPLVFWNKQPKTIKGEVDLDTMNNKFFKYTYYVGVDAVDGGRVQGEMIKNYLEDRYLESIGAKTKL